VRSTDLVIVSCRAAGSRDDDRSEGVPRHRAPDYD